MQVSACTGFSIAISTEGMPIAATEARPAGIHARMVALTGPRQSKFGWTHNEKLARFVYGRVLTRQPINRPSKR